MGMTPTEAKQAASRFEAIRNCGFELLYKKEKPTNIRNVKKPTNIRYIRKPTYTIRDHTKPYSRGTKASLKASRSNAITAKSITQAKSTAQVKSAGTRASFRASA